MKLQNVKPTKYDNLYTQNEAIKFLCDNINLNMLQRVWEPCNGTGKISNFLKGLGIGAPVIPPREMTINLTDKLVEKDVGNK